MPTLSKHGEALRRFAASVFSRGLSTVSRYNRIILMLSVCCGVTAVGIFALRDIRASNAVARAMYTRSLRGLERIAKMQYDVQETRRCTLYALTTSDSNLQVQYADQSRDADLQVKNAIADFLHRPTSPEEQQLGRRLEKDWADYLHVRDEVLASILEGSIADAVRMDLSGGEPAFDRVRRDLLEVQRLYEQDASRGQAKLAQSSRRSSIRLIGILCSTFLLSSLAVIVIQRSRVLNAIQLARLQMEFVASMSHELRTPLAVLGSAADNLADGLVKDPPAVVRYGGIVRRQSRIMRDMVDRILLFASTEDRRLHQNLEPLSIEETIRSLLHDLDSRIRDAGFAIRSNIEPGLPPVLGNRVAIAQCINNLIDNAIKYSGSSRTIEIRAFCARNEDRSPREMRISVADRGMGIEPSVLSRIFDPFYRSPRVQAAQIHGTGLGLSLAKRIAESMAGRLTVESEVGRGSVFTLHLKFAGEEVQLLTVPADSQKAEATHG